MQQYKLSEIKQQLYLLTTELSYKQASLSRLKQLSLELNRIKKLYNDLFI